MDIFWNHFNASSNDGKHAVWIAGVEVAGDFHGRAVMLACRGGIASCSGQTAALVGGSFLAGPSSGIRISVTPMAVPSPCDPAGALLGCLLFAVTASVAFHFHLDRRRGHLDVVRDGAQCLMPAQHQPHKSLIASFCPISHDTAQKPARPQEIHPSHTLIIIFFFPRKSTGCGAAATECAGVQIQPSVSNSCASPGAAAEPPRIAWGQDPHPRISRDW